MSKTISIGKPNCTDVQHKEPCFDCPWRRCSMPGWLGGDTVEEWLGRAHGEYRVHCHTALKHECAGLAIYRSNVAKQTRFPTLQLPPDKVQVFSTPAEFREHHEPTSWPFYKKDKS